MQVIQTASAERVDPRVLPDIGAVAAMTAEFDVVEMRRITDAEDGNELVLAAIKASLASIILDPDCQVEHFAVDLVAGCQQVADVTPVHADVMHSAIY